MSAIRHDGYTIRDLSFQLSLMVLGIKKFIETEEIWSKKIELYKAYFGEFERQLRPALLNLSVNFRAMDDEIQSDTFMSSVLKKNYNHRLMAVEAPGGKELELRHVANKIIHARKSFWYDKNVPHIGQIMSLLNTKDEHDVLVIEGDLHGKPWTVGVDLVVLAEQFYEYSEVACENCGA